MNVLVEKCWVVLCEFVVFDQYWNDFSIEV